ncbi:MAG: hypothetical protein AB7G80_06400 [Dongiaceae bacterium]
MTIDVSKLDFMNDELRKALKKRNPDIKKARELVIQGADPLTYYDSKRTTYEYVQEIADKSTRADSPWKDLLVDMERANKQNAEVKERAYLIKTEPQRRLRGNLLLLGASTVLTAMALSTAWVFPGAQVVRDWAASGNSSALFGENALVRMGSGLFYGAITAAATYGIYRFAGARLTEGVAKIARGTGNAALSLAKQKTRIPKNLVGRPGPKATKIAGLIAALGIGAMTFAWFLPTEDKPLNPRRRHKPAPIPGVQAPEALPAEKQKEVDKDKLDLKQDVPKFVPKSAPQAEPKPEQKPAGSAQLFAPGMDNVAATQLATALKTQTRVM